MRIRTLALIGAAIVAAADLAASCPAPAFATPRTSPGGSLPAGSIPWTLALANVNGDEWIDLIAGNFDSNNRHFGGISVMLGEPGAQFAAPISYSTDAGFTSLAVADYDRDGDDDVVAHYTEAEKVRVLKNDRGAFVRVAEFDGADFYSTVYSGDFNGDHRPDFVVAGGDAPITLYLGRGDLTFNASKVNTGSNAETFGATVADLNRDGKDDLVITRANVAVVMFGTANGVGAPITFDFGFPKESMTTAVRAADVDGDHKPDLIVETDRYAIAGLVLDAGNGTNAKITSIPITFFFDSERDVFADFDHDGDDDLARAFSGVEVVRIANGTLVTARDRYMVAGARGGDPYDLVAGDFDHDGDIDVVAATGTAINVLRNDGHGNFDSPRFVEVADAVADFNGDGRDDLLVDTVAWISNGDGTFREPPGSVEQGGSSYATGDLNGDGKLDFVSLGESPQTLKLERIVGLGNGDGTFRISRTRFDDFDYQSAPRLADFDGDGKLDFIAPTFADRVVLIARGNGDGTFGPAIEKDLGRFVMSIDVGDFNGDRKPDLLLERANEEYGTSIVLNDGTGSFNGPVMDVDYYGDALAVADFNGDGRDDIAVVVDRDPPKVRLLLSKGDGTFFPPRFFEGTVPSVGDVIARDLNNDGKADLFISENNCCGSAGVADIFIGGGADGFAPVLPIITSGNPWITIGDFNRDGAIDLDDGGFIRLGTCGEIPPRRRALRH